jgi:hypothetical protein
LDGGVAKFQTEGALAIVEAHFDVVQIACGGPAGDLSGNQGLLAVGTSLKSSFIAMATVANISNIHACLTCLFISLFGAKQEPGP